MKNKLSILALISAATFSCGNAFAADTVILYDEKGNQVDTFETIATWPMDQYLTSTTLSGYTIELLASQNLSARKNVVEMSSINIKSSMTGTCNLTGRLPFWGNELSVSGDDIVFTSGSSDSDGGGSIYLKSSSATLLLDGSIQFKNSNISLGSYASGAAYGGAVRGDVTISQNSSVAFSGNKAQGGYGGGGAIYGDLSLAENVTATFSNNSAIGSYGSVKSSYGGAVNGNVTTAKNCNISFIQNKTQGGNSKGGAINGEVTIGENTSATFSGNSVYGDKDGSGALGGAVYGDVSIAKGAIVSFTNNSVSLVYNSWYTSYDCRSGGGAIYGKSVTISSDSRTSFQQNQVSDDCYPNTPKAGTMGGAIFASSKVNLAGEIDFTGNSAASVSHTGDGGAIYTPTLTFTSTDTSEKITFQDNEAKSSGGAIYISGGGSGISFASNYSGSILFSGNTANSGGAIYTSAGSLSLAGEVQFSENTAGAKGGAIYSTGELSFAGVAEFSKNIAQSTSLGGGAIYHDGANATDGTIYIKSGSDLSFDQNRVETGHGGAIYTTKAILVSGNTRTNFSGNYAKINGGAIHTSHTFNVEGGTHEFINNTAEGSGGAFSTISGISLKAGSSFAFSGNKAQKMGGAIYSNGSSYDAFELAGDTKFENNYAKGQGGAIYAAQALTISGGTHTFYGNDSVARGGAITATSSITVNSGATVTFDDNYAYVFGGALYLTGKAGINLDQGSVALFSNNTAYSGGAFYLWGDVNLSGKSEFKNNKAEYYTRTENITGGAIHTSGKVSFGEAAEANFDGNSVVATEQIDARGGAIYAASAELRGKLAFENNSIVATGASTNLSGVGGGAIYSEDAVTVATTAMVKFAGNSVSNATKAFGGGAIWAKSLSLAGTLEFVGNSAVNPNSATGLAHGGAILSLERISFDAATNATFSQNTAAFGGAVRVIDGGLSFSGNGGKLTFSENVAGAQGGAIYAGNSGLTPKISLGGDVMFSANKAGKAGGAIYLGGDSTLEFSGDATKVVFSENKIGNDADGWTGNDIAAFGKKNSITIADAGTYKFGGGIDASVGNAVSIADANVTFGGESVNKFAGALTVANSASVTLEKGAALDLLSGGQLAVTSNAELLVRTNLAGVTVINVAQGASVSFDNTAKLVIDLSTTASPLARSVAPTSEEAAQIAIICASDGASIGDINNVELRVDGSAFTGDWSLSRENNTLYLVASIPEPSSFGLLAGLGALLLVGMRRRRKA